MHHLCLAYLAAVLRAAPPSVSVRLSASKSVDGSRPLIPLLQHESPRPELPVRLHLFSFSTRNVSPKGIRTLHLLRSEHISDHSYRSMTCQTTHANTVRAERKDPAYEFRPDVGSAKSFQRHTFATFQQLVDFSRTASIIFSDMYAAGPARFARRLTRLARSRRAVIMYLASLLQTLDSLLTSNPFVENSPGAITASWANTRSRHSTARFKQRSSSSSARV